VIALRLGDPSYPHLLARAPAPPPVLWVEGHPEVLSWTAVAVVGSRAATQLGLQMAERIAAGLACRGVVVVSGCARGIDAAAHRAALAAGGTTVAVLAGGLDVAAPPSNRRLAKEIARDGCLVSEQPAGVAPVPYLFPLRNRIIAGLARVTVVIEASERSGALITARLALEAGREVMAVPGHPLLHNAGGVNGLLRDGARPALSVDDVIDELTKLPPEPELAAWVPEAATVVGTALEPETPLGRRLLAALGETPQPAEVLAAKVRAPLPAVLAELTELEILGIVRTHPGQRFGPVPAVRVTAG
jgi:DNA processing protein